MAETKKTRGVFAIIFQNGGILLSERQDGKGWNLPGGRVEEGENDYDALVREVQEETGLEVEVLEQLGPPHVFNDDTAVAYICCVTGGRLAVTNEARSHHYATAEELRQGFYQIPWKEDCDGISMLAGYQMMPLKLVGPEGRLGRTGRMVWDGLSLLGNPVVGPNEVAEEMLPIEGIFASDDGQYLVDETMDGQRKYRRLDPHSPTGYIQPQS